ncbi:MAG TPA: redox-sensing transcriptional repressor Rex [Anaerolineaceae bacterium]|nr:redox-sensing transcriptional repressor Rex [Anaerolineaceae bacterium]
MTDKPIPDVIVGRLPRYLRALRQMSEAGAQTTSSQELGERLGISAAQIRKDLSQFGEFGKQGTGYSISFLVRQLQAILKVDRTWEMVLVGAGDLGHAIAGYNGFANWGFHVAMVFDNDPQKIGKKIDEYTILDMSELSPKIKESGIQVAMITTPASAAQEVVDQLVKAGIKSILNYAPINLHVPNSVKVQYIDPVIHLQRMTYYLD